MDVSAVTDQFVLLAAAITTVGLAKLGPAALAMSYKWIKGMIFG